jgi:hypothetical protein
MVDVRSREVSNRSISTMGDMRKMADDSKGTLIALTLELMRIEITNEHMRSVIDYLGQAVNKRINVDRYLLVLEAGALLPAQ